MLEITGKSRTLFSAFFYFRVLIIVTYFSSFVSWFVVIIGIVLGLERPLTVVSPPYNQVNN